MFFVIEFFHTIASYQFLKNDCIFMNRLIFLDKIISTILLFLILKINSSVAKIVQTIFLKKTFLLNNYI